MCKLMIEGQKKQYYSRIDLRTIMTVLLHFLLCINNFVNVFKDLKTQICVLCPQYNTQNFTTALFYKFGVSKNGLILKFQFCFISQSNLTDGRESINILIQTIGKTLRFDMCLYVYIYTHTYVHTYLAIYFAYCLAHLFRN